MASLNFSVTSNEGELISVNLDGCLKNKEVVELLMILESKVGNHLPPEASAQIKLLTSPNSPLLQAVSKSPAPTTKASDAGLLPNAKAKRRLAAAKQVAIISGKVYTSSRTPFNFVLDQK